MRPFVAQLAYSPKMISVDRFKVGEATGLMLDGRASFDRMEATGGLTLNATSASMSQISNCSRRWRRLLRRGSAP